MVTFLFGQDHYVIRKKLAELRSRFMNDFERGRPVHFTMDQFDFALFANSIHSSNLFSPVFFVSVEGLLAHTVSSNHGEDIKTLIVDAKKDQKSHLVFVEPIARGAKPRWSSPALIDQIASSGQVIECRHLSRQQRVDWVKEEVKKAEKTIVSAACERLVHIGDQNSFRLANELRKILAFVQGSTVTLSHVLEILPPDYADDIFAFTDSLGHRKSSEALKRLHRLLKSGHPPLVLLSMMIRHLRILRNIALRKTQPASEISKDMKLHPYVVQKSLQQVHLFSMGELQSLCQELEAIDHEMKSKNIDPKIWLDLYILRFSRSHITGFGREENQLSSGIS